MRYLWKSQARTHTKSEMESQSGFALRWGITGVRRQRGCSGFCRPPDFDPIHRRSEIYSHRIDFPVLLSAPAVSSAWNTEHSWGGLPIFSQILFSSQISFVIECSAHLAELCNYKKSVAAEWEGRPHVSDIRQCNDQSNRWHGFFREIIQIWLQQLHILIARHITQFNQMARHGPWAIIFTNQCIL